MSTNVFTTTTVAFPQVDTTMQFLNTLLYGNSLEKFDWGYHAFNGEVAYLIMADRIVLADIMLEKCPKARAEGLAKRSLNLKKHFFYNAQASSGLFAGIKRNSGRFPLVLQVEGVPPVVAYIFQPLETHYAIKASTLTKRDLTVEIINGDLLIIVEHCVAENLPSTIPFKPALSLEDIMKSILALDEEQQFILVSQIG